MNARLDDGSDPWKGPGLRTAYAVIGFSLLACLVIYLLQPDTIYPKIGGGGAADKSEYLAASVGFLGILAVVTLVTSLISLVGPTTDGTTATAVALFMGVLLVTEGLTSMSSAMDSGVGTALAFGLAGVVALAYWIGSVRRSWVRSRAQSFRVNGPGAQPPSLPPQGPYGRG